MDLAHERRLRLEYVVQISQRVDPAGYPLRSPAAAGDARPPPASMPRRARSRGPPIRSVVAFDRLLPRSRPDRCATTDLTRVLSPSCTSLEQKQVCISEPAGSDSPDRAH
jgi:hypothetical protein